MAVIFETPIELTLSAYDTTYEDVDVSAHLGGDTGNVAGIILQVHNIANAQYFFRAKAKGAVEGTSNSGFYNNVTRCVFVKLDSNDVFECFASNSNIKIYLLGYFKNNEAHFFVDPPTQTLTALSTYEDIDFSAEFQPGHTPTFAIIKIINTQSNSDVIAAVRPNGNSDTFWEVRHVRQAERFHIIALDGSGLYEGYSAGPSTQTHHLIGYIYDNATVVTPTSYATATTAAYEDVDFSANIPAGDKAAIYLTDVPDGITQYSFGIRENGQAYDYYGKMFFGVSGIIRLDTNRVAEQKIDNIAVDLYLLGYLSLTNPAQIITVPSITPTTAFGSPTLTSFDPYFENVVLLTHFDGTDGETTEDDISNSNHTLTFNGNAQIDTAQSKFGGASLLLDGTGDFVSTPDSDDWYLGTDPFTIEFWLRFNSTSGDQCFISHVVIDAATHGWYIDRTGGRLRLATHEANGSNFSLLNPIWSPVTGQWYHICAEREADGTHTLYVDGVILQQSVLTIRDVANVADGVRIGSLNFSTARYTNGWIDDVRITKGVARYNGTAFTPPVQAFPDIGPPQLKISPTGIASTVTFGNPTVTNVGGQQEITVPSIAPTTAFGTPSLSLNIHPTGIAPTTAFGSPTLEIAKIIRPSGIASTLAFGTLGIQNQDGHFDNVVLLVKWNGTDGSQIAEDLSLSAHTITWGADAHLDTAMPKFGSAAFEGTRTATVDPSPSYAQVGDSDDWHFGTSPFTLELFVAFKSPLASADQHIISQYLTTGNQRGWSLTYTQAGQLQFIWSTNGSFLTSIGGAWTPTPGTYYHIAVDRDASNNMGIYVDGAIIQRVSVGGTSLFNATAPLLIGKRRNAGTDDGPLHGWIDDVRITKGVARYAGAFTAPVLSFPVPDDNVIRPVGIVAGTTFGTPLVTIPTARRRQLFMITG